MSVRVQVILSDEEAGRFRAQAGRENKSLSAWLREAGNDTLARVAESGESLNSPDALNDFFRACDAVEEGREPDWEEHKRLVAEGKAKYPAS